MECVDFTDVRNKHFVASSIRLISIWKCRSTKHHWFYQRNPFS